MHDLIDSAKAAAEVLKAIAWPLAAVIIATIIAPKLKGLIDSLASRDVELKGPGFEARMSAVKQQEGGDNPASGNALAGEQTDMAPAPSASPRQAVALIEGNIRNELGSVDPTKKEQILIRALAESRLQAGHEFTYNRIFGSQIAALKRVNEKGSATVDEVLDFFKPIAEKFPQIYNGYGFEGWFSFLKTNSLVEQVGDSIRITAFGRDFLLYLTNTPLTELKPF